MLYECGKDEIVIELRMIQSNSQLHLQTYITFSIFTSQNCVVLLYFCGTMNFLMRSSSSSYSERTPLPPPRSASGSNLEKLASQDSHARHGDDATIAGLVPSLPNKHLDVSVEEGFITIPFKELPENWNHVPDIQSLCSLDRSFLFPGEQVYILACLSASKQDTDMITPVATAMSKNGVGQSPERENENIKNRNNLISREGQLSTSVEEHLEDFIDGESLCRMEAQKRRTELLLQKFENSHFFVRISEFDEPLWSKRGSAINFFNPSDANGLKALNIQIEEPTLSSTGVVIDRGNFNATTSGGLVRDSVKCSALPNGDIVILLQMNVGVDSLKDPCIEVLQFEKCPERKLPINDHFEVEHTNEDPCAELLNWMLPLDNNLSPRLQSPPNLRCYSMSSLPQSMSSPSGYLKAVSSMSNFLENRDQILSNSYLRRKFALEGLLSFRGVSLEQERFSVCCGLEGLHTPGRRWRRKLEIVQPLEIHSFATDCNSEDLLCIQMKNVAPSNVPDIVIFIDTISVVLEETTRNGPMPSLLISCVEAGNDHSLPNLTLRRGEEHSFVVKPATSMKKSINIQHDTSSQFSKQFQNRTSKLSLDGRNPTLINDQYAIVVSYRCNYTASRLFFKQQTSWRPCTSKDIMISVSSEMLGQYPRPYATCQLPVQILTLQASNLTSEDLTLTMLSPASFSLPPSLVSLSSPTTPRSPFIGFADFLGRVNSGRSSGATQPSTVEENGEKSSTSEAKAVSTSDVVPNSGLSCTHLWLQSKVPLGCIPAQSIATVRLELLPLTDGIITLDSLQIDVKEKGITYTPGCALKINSTSSIPKGIS
ncbi:uncharacterized protein LOC107489172 [Arachis duranensis]|uniref:Uncharacterized protein LOC107489172 n=1 Tax=Arachis duranensis TaxID=130453 RepID=A0A6P4DB88_ARADU|nr:uncharacterized protein LOC107489172 [Arachis duranensis]